MKKKSIDHTQLLLLKLLSTEDMYEIGRAHV